MKVPISFRKDPHGPGAFLHDAFDKHLGYTHAVEIAELIVAAVNAKAEVISSSHDEIHEEHMRTFGA